MRRVGVFPNMFWFCIVLIILEGKNLTVEYRSFEPVFLRFCLVLCPGPLQELMIVGEKGRKVAWFVLRSIWGSVDVIVGVFADLQSFHIFVLFCVFCLGFRRKNKCLDHNRVGSHLQAQAWGEHGLTCKIWIQRGTHVFLNILPSREVRWRTCRSSSFVGNSAHESHKKISRWKHIYI